MSDFTIGEPVWSDDIPERHGGRGALRRCSPREREHGPIWAAAELLQDGAALPVTMPTLTRACGLASNARTVWNGKFKATRRGCTVYLSKRPS